MKKKLYILGLVVILGLEEVVNGVTYRYTCKENGEIVVSPLP